MLDLASGRTDNKARSVSLHWATPMKLALLVQCALWAAGSLTPFSHSDHRYERSEVPMQIVPQPSISRHCLDALVEVPKIFTGEEKEAYFSTTKVKDLDLITQIHNGTGESYATMRTSVFRYTTDQSVTTVWFLRFSTLLPPVYWKLIGSDGWLKGQGPHFQAF